MYKLFVYWKSLWYLNVEM